MPDMPYYELNAPREDLDRIRKESGLPDNAIQDATGTVDGSVEPESAEALKFLAAGRMLLKVPPPASSEGSPGADDEQTTDTAQ